MSNNFVADAAAGKDAEEGAAGTNGFTWVFGGRLVYGLVAELALIEIDCS
jgi:hypothetical protein